MDPPQAVRRQSGRCQISDLDYALLDEVFVAMDHLFYLKKNLDLTGNQIDNLTRR